MAQATDWSEINDNDSISRKTQETLTIDEPLSSEKTSNQHESPEKYQDNSHDACQETMDNLDSTNASSFTLMELPPELILFTFSFIEARFAMTVLCQVCKFFNQLLSSEASWKTRFGKRWPKRDRKEDYDYVISWKRICVDHEDMDRFWQDPEQNFDFFQLKKHFAPVDAAIVMAGGKLCVSGSRDRSVGVWDLSLLKDKGDEDRALVNHLDGHKGWVWCLASDPTGASRVCSGSWDNSIKIWDLESRNIEMTTIREHKAAVLCIDWKHDVLISGCYDKYVRMFDLRDSHIVSSLKYHTKPVLCLSVDDKYIITGSEDQTLCIYDRRASKVYKVLQLPSPAFSICRSSSSGYSYLRAGGRNGSIHMFDTTADSFEALETPLNPENPGELTGKICGLCHHGGAIIAASSDHSIKVLEPSRVQTKMYSFEMHTGDVASVHSNSGILASASSDLTVGIWRPRSLRPF
ncbi:F-box/WD repeat-containing protein 9 [Exaiptasia diaphana]|uniref:F-box domain-containing protein n=1 Tax=Exaiptasia diaphana TaxID=2652724 RepID=A0A913XNM7_EXADI|nr:F-box/WD repeat-containing protein 9 [Exaiptasia diaphana]